MEVKEVQEQSTLHVREITPVSKLSQLMSRVYPEIAAYAGRKGLTLTGPPYAMYYNMDMDALDVEVGFPVASTDEGEGQLKRGTLPAGKIAAALHKGSYDSIGETYNSLTSFVQDQNLTPSGLCYEFYLNDPGQVKPEELRTEICFVLK